MEDIECQVTWKEKSAKMVLRLEDEEVKGYVNGKTHALTLARRQRSASVTNAGLIAVG